MKRAKLNLSTISIVIMSLFTLVACNNDEETTPSSSGEATMEMTDAPIDNAEVEGVFVTVTDIKVDGQSFEGFSGPQTIDLLAYQNGKTKIMGTGELAAKSYSSLTLELDLEKDASGSTPGSYVLAADGTKHRLGNSTQSSLEVTTNKAYTIQENASSNIVIDFDLRKAVKQNESEETDEYSFVTAAKLNNAVRVVAKDKSGEVRGKYDENNNGGSADSKTVVYAYHKGTFDADTETQGEVLFENAVTSAVVGESSLSNDFVLAFLEEGEYDLRFVRYNDSNNDGKLSFETLLEVSSQNNASLNAVNVEAGANVLLDISVTGVL